MTTTAEPATPPATLRTGRLIGLLVASAFVVILNETIMGVALPRLMDDLQITAATAQWLTTGFLLTMEIVIPLTGYLLARFPLRRNSAWVIWGHGRTRSANAASERWTADQRVEPSPT